MNETLSYQLLHLNELKKRIDLRGKCVLEIGGCLPRSHAIEATGASRWIGVDLPDYWQESGDDNPSQSYEAPRFPIGKADDCAGLDYALLLGDAIDLPKGTGPFNAVFSSCAFEHIQGLEERLRAIRNFLAPGGVLLAVAMPIWSSPHGAHLLPIRDNDGKTWQPEELHLPDWHQLLLTPEEMAKHLSERKIPVEIIDKAVDWVHRSPHLNRLFAGDYVQLAESAGYSTCSTFFPEAVGWANRETMQVLEMLYPGKGPFDRAGIMIELWK